MKFIVFSLLLVTVFIQPAQAAKLTKTVDKAKDIFYVIGVNTELSSMLSGYQFAYQESPKVSKITFNGYSSCLNSAEIEIWSKSIGEKKQRQVKLQVKKPSGCYLVK